MSNKILLMAVAVLLLGAYAIVALNSAKPLSDEKLDQSMANISTDLEKKSSN